MSVWSVGVTDNTNEPLASVVVPALDPTTLIVTPGKGSLVVESITLPEIALF